MSKRITMVYEKGVLCPLQAPELPENSELPIQIIGQSDGQNGELTAARRALQQAGVIGERREPETALVSDEELEQASETLGAAGPRPGEIIGDR